MSSASQKSWSRAAGSSKRKAPLPQTPATREKAETDQAAQAFCKRKCDRVLDAIKQDQQRLATNEAPLNPDEDEDDNLEHDNGINFENDNQLEPPREDIVHPPQNMADFVEKDTYKTRRIREERAWKNFLRPMLIAYLRCSHITSEWGNPARWSQNNFREAKCYCLASAKKTRTLDVVDRDSESVLCSLDHFCHLIRLHLESSRKEAVRVLWLYSRSSTSDIARLFRRYSDSTRDCFLYQALKGISSHLEAPAYWYSTFRSGN